jgi:hypothetical protein
METTCLPLLEQTACQSFILLSFRELEIFRGGNKANEVHIAIRVLQFAVAVRSCNPVSTWQQQGNNQVSRTG